MKKCSITLFICSLVFIIISVFCVINGFSYKNDYYYSESYPTLNENVYVGGDAYNYIINGTYFTGYMILACGAGISGIMTFCFGLYFWHKSSEKTFNALKAIYEKILPSSTESFDSTLKEEHTNESI